MALPESEVFPLYQAQQYGVYDDNYQYSPVDEESRKIVQRRRWFKYGGVTTVVAAAAVLAVMANPGTSSRMSTNHLDAEADHLFAGLLADQNGFYFPTTHQSQQDGAAHRFLRALSSPPGAVDWSYDWTANAKDAAAIGEYYHAKGMAMADYYRSKFDVRYA
jgi:hypothetical protein